MVEVLERLTVVQPPFGAAGEAALSVGVLRCQTGDNERPGLGAQLTLIVKAALSFAAGPDGALLEEPTFVDPPPPCFAQASALPGADEGELAYPSDFVPERGGVDVLLSGHAYTERPAPRIDAALVVGAVRRAFALVAGGPATTLPLSSAYLRDVDGESPTAPVGPGHVPDFTGFHVEGLAPERYATAATAQRAESIAPDAVVELVGLSPRAPRRALRLPGLAPVARASSRTGEDIPVELRCDTVWIDTDRERIVLVWRGKIALASLESAWTIERVDLWLERASAPEDPRAMRRRLQRGLFAWAVEEDEAMEGRAPPPIPPEELAAARFARWDVSPEPTLPIAQYARISAELQEKREGRADTLRRHDLDEDGWALEERARMDWMAAAAMRGDAAPAKQFGDHFLAEQERLASPSEAARTVEDYAPVRAAMDRGADPTRVLAAFAMTLPEWMRLDRRMARAASEDPALRGEIERKTRAAGVDPRLLDDESGLPVVEEDDDDEEDT